MKCFGHVVRADSYPPWSHQCRTAIGPNTDCINGLGAQGMPKRRWTDDVKDWSGLSTAVQQYGIKQNCMEILCVIISGL